jgi:glycosyltransferase involved in cell wall biosynthesis
MMSSKQAWPAVTAVVPTLGDRPDLLEQALRSIRTQDYPAPIECLVVLDRRSGDISPADREDDERWEGTRRVAEAAGARVLENHRTPGLAGSRNTGILAAAGELVANCDDDDYWLPGKLRAQVSALAQETSAVVVCCGIRVEYGETLTERVHPSHIVTLKDLLRSRIMALHVSTFVARRQALIDTVGLVSEEIPGSRSEDYEFLLRAARHGPVINVPQPAVHVRWHTERRAMYGKWPVVAKALPWLLDNYPEFQAVPRGYARVAGQAAFAMAASGDRAGTRQWVRKTIAASPRELRAYIALCVALGLVKPETVVRWLHRRGRGL